MKKEPLQRLSRMMETQSKKSIFVFLLFLLFSITCFSQNIYSKQNLEQASLEELNAYLKLSQKLKKTGTILSIVGPVATVAGIAMFSKNWDNPNSATGTDIGGMIITAGFVTTLIGVPKLIIGSARVKRISEIMESKSVSIELAPCSFHNSITQNTQPCISLRLNF